MKRKSKKSGHRRVILLGLVLLFFFGVAALFWSPWFQPWWKSLTRESWRILGRGGDRVPPEEKRIREELILKRMEEASVRQDWKDLVPEYPRPIKTESGETKDRWKSVKGSPAFREMDQEVRQFLRKKEETLLQGDPPMPPLKSPTDLGRTKDKGTDQVIGRLLASKEKGPGEKPLDENLQLGITGDLASRKIIERPQLPQVKLKVEAEIELTVWVLPNGTVDRAIPSLRGDAELERIAIQYLKQWRFEPLPKDRPQVEQSGAVPIKFKLQ
jgi:TonB family protein